MIHHSDALYVRRAWLCQEWMFLNRWVVETTLNRLFMLLDHCFQAVLLRVTAFSPNGGFSRRNRPLSL